jgi:hypothetical protein
MKFVRKKEHLSFDVTENCRRFDHWRFEVVNGIFPMVWITPWKNAARTALQSAGCILRKVSGKMADGRTPTVAPSLFLMLFCFENISTFFCSFDQKSSDV